MKPITEITCLPIDEALICANCDTVYHILHTVCPRCNSRYYLQLKPILGLVEDFESRRDVAQMKE